MIPIDHVRCLLKERVVSNTMRPSWELPEIKNRVSILLDTSYLDTPARGDTSRMASAGGVPAKGGLWAH